MLFGALRRRGCPGLKAVDVGHNTGLGARGLAAVLAALGPRLETIHFGTCAMGDEGFVALAAAMPRLTALKTINAGWNGCGDAGAEALAEALPGARALECLDMEGNRGVGAAGRAALGAAAARLGALRHCEGGGPLCGPYWGL